LWKNPLGLVRLNLFNMVPWLWALLSPSEMLERRSALSLAVLVALGLFMSTRGTSTLGRLARRCESSGTGMGGRLSDVLRLEKRDGMV
jgi:hypothetical protein